MLCRSHNVSLRAGPAARPAPHCSFSRPVKSLVVPRAAAAPALAKKEGAASKKDEDDGVVEQEHDVPDPIVTSKQVASFLSTLVEDTNIAELHLKVGSFDLKVRRSSASRGSSHAAAAPAASASISPLASLDLPPVAPATALPLESMDESLVYVNSPKVGIFRRGKYAAGKRVGKGNMVSEGDQVKKGQALGYVEQLGTHFPIESPQAGEIAKFVLEDGAPVEYQQLVVEIAPFFGA